MNMKVFDEVIRVATWNVRSLFMMRKLANIEKEMRRMNIAILGLSEVRWRNSGKLKTD